jgi:glycosyltransferase involved in cell wall biosynthesis
LLLVDPGDSRIFEEQGRELRGKALVAPARYEAYGLGVHEALACGLPAFVSRSAGVAERFPTELSPLLLEDPGDSRALAAKLREWRGRASEWRARVVEHGRVFRERTWDAMASEIVAIAESAP